VVLGDLLGYGPHPRQVLHRLEVEGIPCLLGSTDERIAFGLPGLPREGISEVSISWTREQLGPRELRFLRSLSRRQRFDLAIGRLTLLHGLQSPEERLDFEAPAQAQLELLASFRSRWLVSAGHHIPFQQNVGSGWVLDPGSVGLTLGGEPGADVVLLEATSHELKVSFKKIPYDLGPVIFDLAAWGLPPLISEVLRRGRFPG